MYSLSTSFCVVPRSCSLGDALLLAHELVEQQQHRGGRVDRHRRGDLVERDPVERRAHVVDRVDGHARAPDLAQAARVVGVQAELGRQVEGHRQARRAVREQVAVALVGLLGRRVARVLAHRPRLLAVHLAMHAARVRERARLAQAQVLRQVVLGVERLDLDPRVGEAARVVGADDGGDGQAFLGGHAPRLKSRAPARSRSLGAESRVPRGRPRARARAGRGPRAAGCRAPAGAAGDHAGRLRGRRARASRASRTACATRCAWPAGRVP